MKPFFKLTGALRLPYTTPRPWIHAAIWLGSIQTGVHFSFGIHRTEFLFEFCFIQK